MKVQGRTDRILTSFSFMIFVAIIAGLLTGGYPAYTNEISMISLIIAMTFSLVGVSLKASSIRRISKYVALSIALNYGLLTGLILALSTFFENEIRLGFVVMAATRQP